jgi:hypothetical protein
MKGDDDLESILDWVKDELKIGPIHQFRVKRLTAQGDEEHAFLVEGMRVSPDTIAKHIASNCAQIAEAYAGIIKFKAYVFPPSEAPLAQQLHRSYRFLRFEGEGEEEDERDEDLIDRNAHRLMTAEAFGQSRALHGLLVDMGRALSERNEMEISRLHARIAFLESGRDALYVKEKELLLQEMAIQKQTIESEGHGLLMKHADQLIGQFGPVMVKKLLPGITDEGAKALPASDPAVRLLRSFSPEQLAKLQAGPFSDGCKGKLTLLVGKYLSGSIPSDADAQWKVIFDEVSSNEKHVNYLGALLTAEQDKALVELMRRVRGPEAAA